MKGKIHFYRHGRHARHGKQIILDFKIDSTRILKNLWFSFPQKMIFQFVAFVAVQPCFAWGI